MTHQASPIRRVRLGNMAATADRRPDGSIILQSSATLGAYPRSIVDALAEWMATETVNHGGFDWEAQSSKDWYKMPEGWFITTRYAAKGTEAGRKETYLLFKKIT